MNQRKVLPDAVTQNLADQGFADVVRLHAVRDAIRHSWNGYAESCFGQDEVNPVSGSCENWLNQGNTLIDSLDTLWIAGLKEEFARAREWVASSLSSRLQANVYVSFFESTIRILGGLLATYGLTNDVMFLQKVINDFGHDQVFDFVLLFAFESVICVLSFHHFKYPISHILFTL